MSPTNVSERFATRLQQARGAKRQQRKKVNSTCACQVGQAPMGYEEFHRWRFAMGVEFKSCHMGCFVPSRACDHFYESRSAGPKHAP